MRLIMLRNLVALFCMFTLVSRFCGPVDAETLSIVAKWKKGEQKKIEVTKCKERSEGNDTTLSGCATFDYHWTILDSSDTYLIEWSCDSIHADLSSLPPDDPNVALLNIIKEMKVIYRTDKSGAFDSLVNWIEMRNQIWEIRDHLASNATDTVVRAKFIGMMDKLCANRQAIELLFIREVKLLHGVYGFEQEPDDTLTAEISLPTPFGEELLPGKVNSVVEITPKGTIFVKITSEIDREKAQNILPDMLRSYFAKNGLEIPEDVVIDPVNIIECSSYAFVPSSDWPDSISYERDIILGKARQSEIILFKFEK
jgi:hypothetical protein